MPTNHKWDAELLAEDIALRGWLPKDLAVKADVADNTVYRFLDGSTQTAKTAKKLADAMGYSVRRYLLSARRRRVA